MSKARSRITSWPIRPLLRARRLQEVGQLRLCCRQGPRPIGSALSIGPAQLTAALSQTIRQRTNEEARTTMTEEQREDAENLHEAMRIFNETVRQAAYRGLHV